MGYAKVRDIFNIKKLIFALSFPTACASYFFIGERAKSGRAGVSPAKNWGI